MELENSPINRLSRRLKARWVFILGLGEYEIRKTRKGKSSVVFAGGHLAMGYSIGEAYSEAFGLKASAPLILVFSVLPDIDLLIPFVEHRGPTYCIIVIPLTSSLFLLIYGRTVTPICSPLPNIYSETSHPEEHNYYGR